MEIVLKTGFTKHMRWTANTAHFHRICITNRNWKGHCLCQQNLSTILTAVQPHTHKDMFGRMIHWSTTIINHTCIQDSYSFCFGRSSQPWIYLYLSVQKERPELKANASGYKSAFLQAVQEYNAFGLAENNSKYQLEDAVAEQLYLFKALGQLQSVCLLHSWLVSYMLAMFAFVIWACEFVCVCEVGISDDVWNSLERHLHQYRMENSGQVMLQFAE